MPSFIQRMTDLQKTGPVIPISIAPAFSLLDLVTDIHFNSRYVKVLAMIDTGASGTVIKQGIAEALKLSPVGTTLMTTPITTNIICYRFDVQLLFPSNVIIQEVAVTEAPLQDQHVQCLIGRDVLPHGLLVYNGYDNSFTLSF